jgi:hypothetical protein
MRDERQEEHKKSMYDPFDLSDALIRDLPHVRVVRHASREGRLCRYEKMFKPEGLGDAGYWVQRENEFLLDFALKNLRYVVQLASVKRDSDGLSTPVVESVVTLDAGVTIEDWLRVQPRYANGVTGLHPFQHAGVFLHLLRACLVALREIHRHGIVHCDIKEDNICLPYAPYPFQPNQPIGIDCERIRLIDFAFSITPERPLECPLPILPMAPYQSNLLKTALRADRSGKNRGKLAAQDIDCRADLYSLGYLAGRILDTGLLQPAGPGGVAAMNGAHALVERLRTCDGGRRRGGGRTLLHDELIGDIDNLLGRLGDLEDYRRFEVARVREPREPGADGSRASASAGLDPALSTPLSTPIATPLAIPDSMPALAAVRRDRSRKPASPATLSHRMPVLLTAVLLIGGGGGFWYWKAAQAPLPQAGAEKRVGEKPVPKMDAAARAKAETARAEEARRAAENEARIKAELAAEIKAEAEAQSRTEAAEAEESASPAAIPAANIWTEAESEADAGEEQPAPAAEIDYPGDGDVVGKAVEIQGTLDEMTDDQYAFLVIRSTAERYGRLYYPQGELPHESEWRMKGILGTPNYEYEIFVVATGDPQSAEQLQAPRSRKFGLKSLPENTRVISQIVTVRASPPVAEYDWHDDGWKGKHKNKHKSK